MKWQYCTHFFKIFKLLKSVEDAPSTYTNWGHLLHKYVQEAAKGNPQPIKLIRTWMRFCRFYKLKSELVWAFSGAEAIITIQDKLKAEFGNYKVLDIELRLEMPTEGKWSQVFLGYIDIVLELEDGRIVIADFKSCKSHWAFNKFRDKFKDYQLTLYKNFYSKQCNVDPSRIDTYFITVQRSRSPSKALSFTRVTSGPKKVANAVAWMETALEAINTETFYKNRASCLKYGENYPCDLLNTEHCPR